MMILQLHKVLTSHVAAIIDQKKTIRKTLATHKGKKVMKWLLRETESKFKRFPSILVVQRLRTPSPPSTS